jgi:hypothetical protein
VISSRCPWESTTKAKGEIMRILRIVALCAFLCSLTVIASCSGNGAGGGVVTSGQAQTPTYSDSNVSGTYNLVLAGASASGSSISGSGSITANGSGQITSGSYAIVVNQTATCAGSLAGSYNVNSNGAGSATLTPAPNAASAANGCPSAPLSLSLAVSASGSTIGFSESDSTQIAAGLAVK